MVLKQKRLKSAMGIFDLASLLRGGRRGGPEVSVTGIFFPAACESKQNVAAMLALVKLHERGIYLSA